MSEWMPIETAPKDGTEVDLWMVDETGKQWREPNAYYVRNASYDRHEYIDGKLVKTITLRDGWWAPNHDYDGDPGWCDEPKWFNAHPRQMREMFTIATHWMRPPLPPGSNSSESPWQPIKTAPKDGTVILLLQPATSECPAEPITARWGEEGWTDNARGSWWGFEATHWMPIPRLETA